MSYNYWLQYIYMCAVLLMFADAEDDSLAPDGSDIPLDVVRSAVITGTCDAGFIFGDQGVILHTGTAEGLEDVDGEEEDEADVELGRGCRTKTGSKCYGAEWEQH